MKLSSQYQNVESCVAYFGILFFLEMSASDSFCILGFHSYSSLVMLYADSLIFHKRFAFRKENIIVFKIFSENSSRACLGVFLMFISY